MMEYGLISVHQSAFCCIKEQYNDTISVLLLALGVGAMCGTTIMASIGLSFLFLRAFPTSSNVTTACRSVSAIPSSRLASPNKKSPPESSRNTTTPRSILCTRSNFDSVLHRAREHGGGDQRCEVCGGTLNPIGLSGSTFFSRSWSSASLMTSICKATSLLNCDCNWLMLSWL